MRIISDDNMEFKTIEECVAHEKAIKEKQEIERKKREEEIRKIKELENKKNDRINSIQKALDKVVEQLVEFKIDYGKTLNYEEYLREKLWIEYFRR